METESKGEGNAALRVLERQEKSQYIIPSGPRKGKGKHDAVKGYLGWKIHWFSGELP